MLLVVKAVLSTRGCGEGGLNIRHLNLPEAHFMVDFKGLYNSSVGLQYVLGIKN